MPRTGNRVKRFLNVNRLDPPQRQHNNILQNDIDDIKEEISDIDLHIALLYATREKAVCRLNDVESRHVGVVPRSVDRIYLDCPLPDSVVGKLQCNPLEFSHYMVESEGDFQNSKGLVKTSVLRDLCRLLRHEFCLVDLENYVHSIDFALRDNFLVAYSKSNNTVPLGVVECKTFVVYVQIKLFIAIYYDYCLVMPSKVSMFTRRSTIRVDFPDVRDVLQKCFYFLKCPKEVAIPQVVPLKCLGKVEMPYLLPPTQELSLDEFREERRILREFKKAFPFVEELD